MLSAMRCVLSASCLALFSALSTASAQSPDYTSELNSIMSDTDMMTTILSQIQRSIRDDVTGKQNNLYNWFSTRSGNVHYGNFASLINEVYTGFWTTGMQFSATWQGTSGFIPRPRGSDGYSFAEALNWYLASFFYKSDEYVPTLKQAYDNWGYGGENWRQYSYNIYDYLADFLVKTNLVLRNYDFAPFTTSQNFTNLLDNTPIGATYNIGSHEKAEGTDTNELENAKDELRDYFRENIPGKPLPVLPGGGILEGMETWKPNLTGVSSPYISITEDWHFSGGSMPVVVGDLSVVPLWVQRTARAVMEFVWYALLFGMVWRLLSEEWGYWSTLGSGSGG